MADGRIFPTTRRMSTRVNAGAAGTAPARTGAGRARNAAGGASRERSDGSRTPRDRPGQRPPSLTEVTERRAGRDAPGRQPRRGAHGASGRSRAPVAGRAKRGPPGRQPGRARAQAARCRRVTGLGRPRSRCGACAGLRSISGVAGARGTAAGLGVGHGAAHGATVASASGVTGAVNTHRDSGTTVSGQHIVIQLVPSSETNAARSFPCRSRMVISSGFLSFFCLGSTWTQTEDEYRPKSFFRPVK